MGSDKRGCYGAGNGLTRLCSGIASLAADDIVRSKGVVAIVKRLIGIVVGKIVVALMVLACVKMGRRTANEGKAVIDASRGAFDRARQSADETNKFEGLIPAQKHWFRKVHRVAQRRGRIDVRYLCDYVMGIPRFDSLRGEL